MTIEIRTASSNRLVATYNSFSEYREASPIAGLEATTFDGRHIDEEEFCDMLNNL